MAGKLELLVTSKRSAGVSDDMSVKIYICIDLEG